MSRNRSRHWHFSLLEPRKMFSDRSSVEIEFIDSATRVVIEAPKVKISIPREVEAAVTPPPPTEAQLRKELRCEEAKLRIQRAANAQCGSHSSLGNYKDLWTTMWHVERLRSMLHDVDPATGMRVRHPGVLSAYLARKNAELAASTEKSLIQ